MSDDTTQEGKNFIEKMDEESLSSSVFNETDFVCALANPHIKMAIGESHKYLKIENKILKKLKTLLVDENKSTVIAVALIYNDHNNLNISQNLSEKLSYYEKLEDYDELNEFLTILDKRIKKDGTEKFLDVYIGKSGNNDIDIFIDNMEKMNNNMSNHIITLENLSDVNVEEVKESVDRNSLIECGFDGLNSMMMYGALIRGQLIAVAGAPGRGKTTCMINLSYIYAKAGIKNVFVSMGDMNKSDFIYRIACIHFNQPMDVVMNKISEYYEDSGFINVLDNIKLTCVPSDTLNSKDTVNYFAFNKDIIEIYDIYFWDYDSNFADAVISDMYNSHDKIYNNLYKFVDKYKKLGYVGSQVKSHLVETKFLPLNCMAESSRKTQIVDIIYGVSSIKYDNLFLGVINVPKNRRGRTNHILFTLSPGGRMVEISQKKYDETYKVISTYLGVNDGKK